MDGGDVPGELSSLLLDGCDAGCYVLEFLTLRDLLAILLTCRSLQLLITSGGRPVKTLLSQLLTGRAAAVSGHLEWHQSVIATEIRPLCSNDFDCLRSLSRSERSVGSRVICCPRVLHSGCERQGASDACLLHDGTGTTLVTAIYCSNKLQLECGYDYLSGFASANKSYELQCFPHSDVNEAPSPPISRVLSLSNSCADILVGYADGAISCHSLQSPSPSVAKWAIGDAHGDRIMAIERYDDSCVLSGSRTHEENVRLVDSRKPSAGGASLVLSTHTCVYSLAILGTSSYDIAVGGQRGVQLYDIRRPVEPYSDVDLRHEGAVLSVRYSMTSDSIVFGSKRGFLGWVHRRATMDPVLSIYDQTTGIQPTYASSTAVQTLQRGGASSYSYGATGVRSIVCAETSRRVLACNNDGTIKAFSLSPDRSFFGGETVVDLMDTSEGQGVEEGQRQFTFAAGSPDVVVFCGGLHGLLFVLPGL